MTLKRFFIPALSLLFISTAFATSNFSPTRVRCAFDIGSGETKFAVSRNATIIESDEKAVPIKQLVRGGILPAYALEPLVTQLMEYKKICLKQGANEFIGVATSGFRSAYKNGTESLQKVAERTGIQLNIIDGDEEAKLGFLAVESKLGKRKNHTKLVVWDIGGGSQQFAMRVNTNSNDLKNFEMVSIPIGAGNFAENLSTELKRPKDASLNPISKSEMVQAIEMSKKSVSSIPEKIQQSLKTGTQVVGIGGVHTRAIGPHATSPNNSGVYTIEAVRKLATKAAGLPVADILKVFHTDKYPETAVSNIALVLGEMEKLSIRRVSPLHVTLAHGLLADDSRWKK